MKVADLANGRGSLTQDKRGYLTAYVSVNGKKLFKRVRSQDEGEQFVLSALLDRTDRDELTAKQLNDASNALYLLRKRGVEVSFVDLARHYLETTTDGTVTVAEAAEEYLKRSAARVSPLTLRNYRMHVKRFVAKYGQRKIATIQKKDMISHLSQWEDRRPSWVNAHISLSKFFVECVKYGYISSNPASMLEPPRQKTMPKREYFSPEDAATFLHAVETECPKWILYPVLGMFGGLRPSEALRITNKHVNLETGYIHISGDVTKSHTFKERMVKIGPTLMAWLKRYPPESFGEKPVPTSYARATTVANALYRLAEKHGIHLPGDVYRHSYGTYQFALSGNSAETASQMGHSESVGMKYYRGRVTKESAVKYFAIRPKDDAMTELDSL